MEGEGALGLVEKGGTAAGNVLQDKEERAGKRLFSLAGLPALPLLDFTTSYLVFADLFA